MIVGAVIEALDEIDDICRKNHIHYALHGGALLGAERNGHLIPWDDDLDISMTRQDFESFKAACANYNGRFYLNEIDTYILSFGPMKNTQHILEIFLYIH
jgi:lipopolysaccharide cholinephosphotransferase